MTRIARGMTRLSVLAVVSAMLILTLAIVVWLRHTPAPIARREQTSIDSIAATQPHYDTVRIDRVRVETTYVAKSAQNARQAIGATRVADSLHRIADEAQQAAQAAGEQSTRWFTVAELRGVENDSLRSAITWLDTALTQQTTARIAASSRADAAEQRLHAIDDLKDRLARDLKRGDCRIAWLLDCPSRKMSAVGGAAVDELLRFALKHH